MDDVPEGFIEENLRILKDEIGEACAAAGVFPSSVTLCAVSKTKSIECVNRAFAAGVTVFGENYVQEITGKYRGASRSYSLRMIGHLQSNKIAAVLPYVDSVDSVDSLGLLEKIDRRSRLLGKRTEVLLEINSSGDASKSGFRGDDGVRIALDAVPSLPGIKFRGLMTMGPVSMDESATRKSFESFALTFDRLACDYPHLDFAVKSFGMSGDFRIAIEYGSNMVRIGRAVFGERDYG